jgi:hypothetical protein
MAGLLSPMRIFNGFVIYKFLKYITTDFVNMPAYKLGIIDDKGNFLKKQKDLTTSEEKLASNIFFRLVINLRKVLMKVPLVRSKLGRVASALFLVREEINKTDPSGKSAILVEQTFIQHCEENGIDIKSDVLNESFSDSREPELGDLIEDCEGNICKLDREPVVIDDILGINIYESTTNNQRIIFTKLQVDANGMRMQQKQSSTKTEDS